MLKVLICASFLSGVSYPHSAMLAVDEMTQRPAAPKPSARSPDACTAHLVSRFIGATATPTVRTAIEKATGHNRIRWIRPGTAVTQDFRQDRLNVILDETEQIMTMRCG